MAKPLQLVLSAAIVALVIAVGLDIVAWARRPDRASEFHPRTFGVVLAGVGFLTFAYFAWISLDPPPGWEPSNPADQGYTWFMMLPALLLGAVTVEAMVRPLHAARVLIAIALAVPLGFAALFTVAAMAGADSGDGTDRLALALCAFVSLPAAFTALLLWDQTRPRRAHEDAAETEGHAG